MIPRAGRAILLSLLLMAVLAAGCAPRTRRPAAVRAAEERAAEATIFSDVADSAGLGYRWKVTDPRPLNALQTIGNGCGFLDYDGDGNLDVLLVGSPPALYRGDGKGRFRDVTGPSGLGALRGRFLGCAAGDYDGDGRVDVYLSAYRGGALLRNLGGGRFADASRAAGVAPQPWGTSAAFFDYDGDGDLDLYIGNYLQFGPNTVPQLCEAGPGIETACGPRWYKPEKGVLYRNAGSGRFADATAASGASGVSGKALGVAVADYDGSGRPSLAVANDLVPGDLLRNLGGGRFQDVGPESGTAYDADGNPHGGMGIDWGDYDNDGRFDLFVGTFQKEVKNVYRNEGDGIFVDRSVELGLEASVPYVTFGAKWLDADNDGWLDLLLANGHIQDNIARIDPGTAYRQPTQLFRGEGERRLAEAGALLSDRARRPIVGRGLAAGDFDNDGRVDALVVDAEGAPLLLRNAAPRGAGRHWVGLALRQPGGPNRLAYGAQVTVSAGGRRYLRQCQPAGSYLSSSDPRVHVGLGEATGIETISVKWPDGSVQQWENLPSDRYLMLTRGSASAL